MRLDYIAAITYKKAQVVGVVDGIFANKKSTNISAPASSILKNPDFKRKYNEIIDCLISVLLLICAIMSGLFICIIFLWAQFGKSASSKDVIKGGKVLSANEVSRALRRLGKASCFKIGGMNLVKDKETSHILITGKTGSGKSNCMHNLLPQIRDQRQSAIIVDFTGEMVARYYDAARGDVIINPFDEKAKSWDFWEEVKDKHNLSSIANSLFASKGNNHDDMWNNASKLFFEDAVKHELKSTSPSIQSLYKLLSSAPLSVVARTLAGTASSSMLSPSNDKTAMSIRTNTIAFIDWMGDFQEGGDKISLSDWFRSVDNHSRRKTANKYKQTRQVDQRLEGQTSTNIDTLHGKWLFLTSSPKQRNKLRNFHGMLLDLALNNLMELGPDFNRRIWLIIDELPSLKMVPALPTALSELRKYGGCIVAGLQSANQLFDIYGNNQAYSMLDQFNTKFIFRTEDNNFANYICKNFGDVEYTESNENFSYGAHEMRDGVSFSKIEKRRPLVTLSDLSSLAECEAYVSLPEPSVRVAKLKMEWQKGGKS